MAVRRDVWTCGVDFQAAGMVCSEWQFHPGSFPPPGAAPARGDHLLARWRGVTGPALDGGEHLSVSFAVAPGQLPEHGDVVRLVLSVEDATMLTSAVLDRLRLYLERKATNVQSGGTSGFVAGGGGERAFRGPVSHDAVHAELLRARSDVAAMRAKNADGLSRELLLAESILSSLRAEESEGRLCSCGAPGSGASDAAG